MIWARQEWHKRLQVQVQEAVHEKNCHHILIFKCMTLQTDLADC